MTSLQVADRSPMKTSLPAGFKLPRLLKVYREPEAARAICITIPTAVLLSAARRGRRLSRKSRAGCILPPRPAALIPCHL